MYAKTNLYITLVLLGLICFPFLLFFGCENPLLGIGNRTGLKGTVTIAGMTDASGVVISAEQVTGGQTKSVQKLLGTVKGGQFSTRTLQTTMTDENGSFELTDLEEGTYTVSAEKDDTLGAVETDIIVTSKDVTQVDITLTATGSISGTITLSGTGSEGSFAYVEGSSYVAATASDGSFVISKVPIGTYDVVVYHDGYTSSTNSGVTVVAATDISIGAVDLSPGAAVDTTAPIVVSTDPPQGVSKFPIDAPIKATFSEAMDDTTITTGTFTMSGGVTGTVSYDANSRTATFTPDANLTYSNSYSVTLSTSIADAAGNTLDGDYIWSFATQAQPVPPPEMDVLLEQYDGMSWYHYWPVAEGGMPTMGVDNDSYTYSVLIKNDGASTLNIIDNDSDGNAITVQNHTGTSGLLPVNNEPNNEPWGLDLTGMNYAIAPGTTEQFLLTWVVTGSPENYYATIRIESDDPAGRFFSFTISGYSIC